LGTDLVKDIAFKTSPSLVPMNNFLNGLFNGRGGKLSVRLLGTIMVMCQCGTVELLLVLSSGMVNETMVIG
jgi:hypothetical protein